MAASGDTAVYRVEAVLPTTYGFGWRLPVLEEMQLTARLEHSMNLLEGRIDRGNGAQRVGGKRTIHGSIRQIESGPIAPHPLEGCRDGSCPRLSEPQRGF